MAVTGVIGGRDRVTVSRSMRDSAGDLLARMLPEGADPFGVGSSDPPTITTSTSPTLTARVAGPHTGEVTEVGDRGSWVTGVQGLSTLGHGGLDFYHTGTAVEIHIIPGATTTQRCWVFVDGLPVTETPDATSIGSVTASTSYYVKLTWGVSRRRRVEFFAPLAGWWGGVRCGITDVLAPAPRKPVVCWIGDSFWAGSTPSPLFQCANFIASRYLGVECVTGNLVAGSTGYTAAGSTHVFGSSTRTTAADNANPDLIVFQGSVNDDGVAAATIQAAATAAFSAFQDVCPNTPFVVLGAEPTAAAATIGATRGLNIAAVKTAALANSSVIGFHDEIGTGNGAVSAFSGAATYALGDRVSYLGSIWEWNHGANSGNASSPGTQARWGLKTWVLYGTGQVGTTASDGNRDTLVSNDGTHPEAALSSAFGVLTAQKIRDDLATYATTGSRTVD